MNIDQKVFKCYNWLLNDQYMETTIKTDIGKCVMHLPIMTRNDLRNIPKLPEKSVVGKSKSSGSTGEPLVLEKTVERNYREKRFLSK